MTTACILIDHFPFKIERERDPSLQKRVVVIFEQHCSQSTVLDVSPNAQNLKPGTPIQQVLACYADIVPIQSNMPEYHHEFSKIVDRLENKFPNVEVAELGCAYIGLDGLERIYNCEANLIDALLDTVPKHFGPRLGISEGKFTAYLAALTALPGKSYKRTSELAVFLESFPIEVLPAHWQLKNRLQSFGIDTLGKLAGLPLGPVQAQFGVVGAKVWHLAQGIDATPIIPRWNHENVTATLTFPTPTTNVQPLLVALENLLGKLFTRHDMRGRFARLARLNGHSFNGPLWERRIVFKTPLGDRDRAFFNIKSNLANVVLPGPLDDIQLTLEHLTGESGHQMRFFNVGRRREHLKQAIAQLTVAQGHNPIVQVREVEPWSRIPERRRVLVSYNL